MKLLNKFLPADNKKRQWVSVALTILLMAPLVLWGIYGIGKYGIALFVIVPLLIGVIPNILYATKSEITKKFAIQMGAITLGVSLACLLVFAIEGIICIAMAAPIALVLTILGSLIGYAIVNKMKNNATTMMLVLIMFMPLTAFVEKNSPSTLHSVVTSIEINASPEIVWKNVVAFPQLDAPTEFLFKAGIAYPIHATIEEKGDKVIRYCNFNTGSFVEPITVWDEPKLLRFDVKEQPEPMKELSFWDINAPHLHDYFVSKQGQFKLIKLADNKTLLEGTTWYYHNIKPAFYWKWWSNSIIHKIHFRVLNHIKKISENEVNEVSVIQ